MLRGTYLGQVKSVLPQGGLRLYHKLELWYAWSTLEREKIDAQNVVLCSADLISILRKGTIFHASNLFYHQSSGLASQIKLQGTRLPCALGFELAVNDSQPRDIDNQVTPTLSSIQGTKRAQGMAGLKLDTSHVDHLVPERNTARYSQPLHRRGPPVCFPDRAPLLLPP